MQGRTQFIDKRLKYRITFEELVQTFIEPDSSEINAVICEFLEGGNFQPGKNALHQFIIDCYQRVIIVNGLLHLGNEVVYKKDHEQHPSKNTNAFIADIVMKLESANITKQDAENFIGAHSQMPFSFISHAISGALPISEDVKDLFVIKQPNTQRVTYFKDKLRDVLYARMLFDYFECVNHLGETIGIFPGPVELTYKIDVFKNVPGYKLVYIETSNPEIEKVFRGKKLNANDLKSSYCSPMKMKNFHTLVNAQMHALTTLDRNNGFIVGPAVELVEPEVHEVQKAKLAKADETEVNNTEPNRLGLIKEKFSLFAISFKEKLSRTNEDKAKSDSLTTTINLN